MTGEPAAPRMMPVAMWTTTYRAAREPRPESPAPDPVEDDEQHDDEPRFLFSILLVA